MKLKFNEGPVLRLNDLEWPRSLPTPTPKCTHIQPREDSPRGWCRSTLQWCSGLQPTAAVQTHAEICPSLGLLIIIQAQAPKTGKTDGGRPMAGPRKLWSLDGARVSFF